LNVVPRSVVAIQSGLEIGGVADDFSPQMFADGHPFRHRFVLLLEHLDYYLRGCANTRNYVVSKRIDKIRQILGDALAQFVYSVVVELFPSKAGMQRGFAALLNSIPELAVALFVVPFDLHKKPSHRSSYEANATELHYVRFDVGGIEPLFGNVQIQPL
jgi:hypothetical protein